MKRYAIGIDYGTLSARAVLVELSSGREVAVSEFPYPHGVMDKRLPDSTPLDNSAALQHPQDYMDAFVYTMKELLKTEGVEPEEIVGIGIDFTSCTVLTVDSAGKPLCFFEEFAHEPHAYVKLWKHHTAEVGKAAEEVTALAKEMGEEWLDSYGGKISSEWVLPKIMETHRKAPKVYEKAARFIEAGDWVAWQLTGVEVHSSCMAGYKGTWNKSYPSKEFFKRLHPDFENIVGDKLSENILPTGTKAGGLSENIARLTGLKAGTAVAVPIIDAHAALPAAGIVDGGKLMLIIGTSTCHIVMSEEEKKVPGICGAVQDGIIPGYVAYEAGQACVGDAFGWFVENCVPAEYEKEAEEKGISVFALLEEKAAKKAAGESGLLVLDWWNGNRSPYADYDLTSAVFGLTLRTRPEDIYRAFIEATAYGTKTIVDLYESCGVDIDEIYASGGIPQKNRMLVQIYADVLGRNITVPKSRQSGALGSALLASVAGGHFKTMKEAAGALINHELEIFTPIPENHERYKKLYAEYKKLSEYFAEGGNDVLKKLS